MKLLKRQKLIGLLLAGFLVSSNCYASVKTDPLDDFCSYLKNVFEQLFASKEPQASAPEQPQITQRDIKNLRATIKHTIKKLNADYASETDRIASAILATLKADNLHEFSGASLDAKVNHEMTRIYLEQKEGLKAAHKKKAARQPSKIKKLYTNEDCCVCLCSFASLGTRRYLDPCGHDICPSCYAQLDKKICPQCRAELKGYEDVAVQVDHNPECDEPSQPNHNPETDVA